MPATRLPASLLAPDPDEGEEKIPCAVCDELLEGVLTRTSHGTPYVRAPRRSQRVCSRCQKAGWRSSPCVSCGGVTRAWNWTSKARRQRLRGYCPFCRRRDAMERSLL